MTSAFRNRGVKVVVDTMEQAEFDFAKLNVTEKQQEIIARNLKETPNSTYDRYTGELRVRIICGYDIAFTVVRDDADVAVIIIGAEMGRELEGIIDLVMRSSLSMLPPAFKVILEGRRKRPKK